MTSIGNAYHPVERSSINGERNGWLDLMRIGSFLRVYGLHFATATTLLKSDLISRHMTEFLRFGVSCFLVMSGYLIGRRLVVPGFDGFTFLKGRMVRILPSYLLFLLLSQLLIASTLGGGLTGDILNIGNFWTDVTFLSNYKPGIRYHLWSVALEVQFYVVVAVFGSKYANLARLPRILLLVISYFAIMSLRITSGTSSMDSLTLSLRGDDLIAGLIAAEIADLSVIRSTSVRIALIVCGVTCCLLGSILWKPLDVMRGTIFNIGFACLVLVAAQSTFRSPALLGTVARLTYNGFLWHEILGAIGFGLVGAPSHPNSWWWLGWGLVAGILLTLGVAGVIFRTIEITGVSLWRRICNTRREQEDQPVFITRGSTSP